MENNINKNKENKVENKNLLDIVKDIFGNNISVDNANCILNKYTNYLNDTQEMIYEQLQLTKIIIDEKQEKYNLSLEEVIALDK